MKILAVDTTAAAASVALSEDDTLIGEYFVNIKQTHSQTLMPMVGSIIKSCNINISDIDLFAVSCGPGSFTGVRIGVAAVKGLALPLGKPCAAVSALEALALNLSATHGVVCSVMDARRKQFYNAVFESSDGELKRLTEDRAIAFSELKNEIFAYVNMGKTVFLIGDGAKLCYNMLSEESVDGIVLAPQNCMYARASSVALAGFRLYNAGKTVTPEELLPSYLRLPQAERELNAKRKSST